MTSFKAFRIHHDDQGYRSGIQQLQLEQLNPEPLGPGEVLLENRFSSVNYKDALAGTGKGKVVRRFPLIGGIDCAGEVLESTDPRFQPGDPVLATGFDLGVAHHGGYARYVRLPADWLVPLPPGLGPFMAMVLGTAGFTAGLALQRMEQNGQTPAMGPVLVTGASGGVGSIATALLAASGYEVVAISGKPDQQQRLLELGASQVLSRQQLALSERPLDKAQWGGLIDSVGGNILAGLLPQIQPWGNVACIGMANGADLYTTVMPFILRGVSLLGIDSVTCPIGQRSVIWQRLAMQLSRPLLERLVARVIPLEDLPTAFDELLAGEARGRILVETR
ncbi:MAG: oxidoreductase [Gammaproteobacteria bacterium]|nr:oxidoreductase [Gammaproteobacteria bacterium]